MRHMMRAARALMHILPRTMKAVLPNIFFSSTLGTGANAALTRLKSSLSCPTGSGAGYFGNGALSK